MKPYKNLSGNSGVIAYEIGEDYVKVKFIDGDIYLYNVKSAGKSKIEQMKKKAVAGKGLSTFISTSVRNAYAAKFN